MLKIFARIVWDRAFLIRTCSILVPSAINEHRIRQFRFDSNEQSRAVMFKRGQTLETETETEFSRPRSKGNLWDRDPDQKQNRNFCSLGCYRRLETDWDRFRTFGLETTFLETLVSLEQSRAERSRSLSVCLSASLSLSLRWWMSSAWEVHKNGRRKQWLIDVRPSDTAIRSSSSSWAWGPIFNSS